MLRIALPNKGRLSEDTRALFNDAGLEVRAAGERALTASLGGEFEAIFVRAQDIPEFVADGAADAGVTGWDLVNESGRPLADRLDLGFGRCRLVVAAREDSGITRLEDIRALGANVRVASVFPRITAAFFAERDIPVDVVPVSGAAEIAPHLGIADIVVDLTSTGSTLKTNGLREIAVVMASSARLITAPAQPLSAERTEAIDELITALESVVRGRAQRYLMANVPRAALDAVREVLPGLNGPTVVDILNGGTMVAVHAVVPAKAVYRTITRLRALGAEGMLVTRIERLVP
jgi:ATP phosphoribosyltransferase